MGFLFSKGSFDPPNIPPLSLSPSPIFLFHFLLILTSRTFYRTRVEGGKKKQKELTMNRSTVFVTAALLCVCLVVVDAGETDEELLGNFTDESTAPLSTPFPAISPSGHLKHKGSGHDPIWLIVFVISGGVVVVGGAIAILVRRRLRKRAEIRGHVNSCLVELNHEGRKVDDPSILPKVPTEPELSIEVVE